mmetsp:Transcript_36030/g.103078  ORF Transcript_36030/g.103078 Transcript_36030/m.103078 type:complete len:272 (-) Transcript_36030:667-1482(-)
MSERMESARNFAPIGRPFRAEMIHSKITLPLPTIRNKQFDIAMVRDHTSHVCTLPTLDTANFHRGSPAIAADRTQMPQTATTEFGSQNQSLAYVSESGLQSLPWSSSVWRDGSTTTLTKKGVIADTMALQNESHAHAGKRILNGAFIIVFSSAGTSGVGWSPSQGLRSLATPTSTSIETIIQMAKKAPTHWKDVRASATAHAASHVEVQLQNKSFCSTVDKAPSTLADASASQSEQARASSGRTGSPRGSSTAASDALSRKALPTPSAKTV